ncbi:protein FAM24B-like [Cervus elaphus]|uniref:protein FAM24B-like n=1 Tax=Cervus canadensis TaxID=1574408 RepID=UPI001C9E6B0C|nr:protein FAM24B-like [Cervus canadensis]XP_043781322.1 protein FAM24B-like [Cervus elaphus]
MYCSLKFILIVIFFYCQPSSSFDDLDSHKNSKVNAIIMFCIGGAILLAMLVLMAVVICLYYKVANALNMPKVPVCLALKNNPAVITPDKVSAALTTGSYPSLQCCDECNLYPGFDALPPCCCNVNEGL